jgi:hypothetical protein
MHGVSPAHVTVEHCMRIKPNVSYFLTNGDWSTAHGYNKKSHEYETFEQVLRHGGHDY